VGARSLAGGKNSGGNSERETEREREGDSASGSRNMHTKFSFAGQAKQAVAVTGS